jgi:hypothetical protein
MLDVQVQIGMIRILEEIHQANLFAPFVIFCG